MLATGRSVSMTLPVVDRLGITPEYLVCANGAIVLGRDADAPLGYSQRARRDLRPDARCSPPSAATSTGASYAVEDARRGVPLHRHVPRRRARRRRASKVEFDELLGSRGHPRRRDLARPRDRGLPVGGRADGSAQGQLQRGLDGVARHRARRRQQGDRARVRDATRSASRRSASWRSATAATTSTCSSGRSPAAGSGSRWGRRPPEVLAVATERTGTDLDDGVAVALARHFQD